MKNKKYVLDLLKSEDEQLRKMHAIIEKALTEKRLSLLRYRTTTRKEATVKNYRTALRNLVAAGGSSLFSALF